MMMIIMMMMLLLDLFVVVGRRCFGDFLPENIISAQFGNLFDVYTCACVCVRESIC